MRFFKSARERTLWLAALSAVGVIYGTLPLLGVLARSPMAEGLLGALFGLGFAGAIVATLANGLRSGRGRELWIGIGVVAVYLTVFVRLNLGPLERTHLFEYGVVAVLIYEALLERARRGGRVLRPAPTAIVAGACLGWLDEGIQLLSPARVYDLRDVGVNALAALLAVSATWGLRWARRGRRAKR